MNRQKPSVNIFWFRRDLRLDDNAGLFHALRSGRPVLPIFIFDREILDKLEDRKDRRVAFIHRALTGMQEQLSRMGSTLEVLQGTPLAVFRDLTQRYSVESVFTNHDYEPYARRRDRLIEEFLRTEGAAMHRRSGRLHS